MSEDLIQQVAQNVPAVGAGGLVGGGGLIALLKVLNIFCSPQYVDQKVELLEAKLRAEIAEKYLAKEALAPMFEEIRHIRERVDQLIDRK